MTEQLCQEFSDHTMLDVEDLDELIDKFNAELTRVMDTLAPEKEITISTHKRQPWYDETVKNPT